MTKNRVFERPEPFAQDPAREPPTKDQREKDYATEKKVVGDAAKKKPGEKRDA